MTRRLSDRDSYLDWLTSLSDEEYAQYADSGYPEIPRYDSMPWVVDYSTRGPNDFILSGPLGNARGKGRRFATVADALQWAREKFGKERVELVKESESPEAIRWAVKVKQ